MGTAFQEESVGNFRYMFSEDLLVLSQEYEGTKECWHPKLGDHRSCRWPLASSRIDERIGRNQSCCIVDRTVCWQCVTPNASLLRSAETTPQIATSMDVQEVIHIPVAVLQEKLSFVSTDPLPWKNYVLATSTAIWAFETYLLYVGLCCISRYF